MWNDAYAATTSKQDRRHQGEACETPDRESLHVRTDTLVLVHAGSVDGVALRKRHAIKRVDFGSLFVKESDRPDSFFMGSLLTLQLHG